MDQYNYHPRDETIGTYRDRLIEQLLELIKKKQEVQLAIDNVIVLLNSLDNKDTNDKD